MKHFNVPTSLLLLVWIFSGCAEKKFCHEISTLPLYGTYEKCEEQIEADSAFLQECDRVFKDRKKAAIYLIDEGWQYNEQGALDSAMRRFNQAWLLDSSNADIYWGIGTLLGRQLQFEESSRYFKRSLSINPKNPKVWVGSSTTHGQLYYTSSDTTYLMRAIKDLKQCILLDPGFGMAYGQLAANYYYLPQIDSAKKYMRMVDSIDPKILNPEFRKSIVEYDPNKPKKKKATKPAHSH